MLLSRNSESSNGDATNRSYFGNIVAGIRKVNKCFRHCRFCSSKRVNNMEP